MARTAQALTAVALTALALLAGCAASGIGGGIVGGVAEPDRVSQMEPCNQARAFAFAGEATLAELDLGDQAWGPDATRRGFIWITLDDVSFGPDMPRDPGMAPSRWLCLEWPDGSGMAMLVEQDWQPPGIGLDDAATSGEEDLPVPLLVIALSAILLAGSSYLAFRQRPER
jgi:hypothetical protein